MNGPFKLLMTWDILPGREEAYFAFVTQDFPAILQNAGLQMTDAWYTVYGSWPQVRMGFVADDPETIRRFLTSPIWEALKQQLLQYVERYRDKIVRARGGFQI